VNDSIVIQSRIDSNQLDRIEEECSEMLYQQRLLYNERWYASPLLAKMRSILRLLGLVVSLLGVALCVFYLLYPSTCPKWFYAEASLVFFILAAALFYYLPRIDSRLHARFKKLGKRGSQKMARRFVARARKQAPFDAKYEVEGDRINYYRGRADQWKRVWGGKAKGFALVGRNVTLLFRKPTSLMPRMLILCDDPNAVATVLTRLGMEYKTTFRN